MTTVRTLSRRRQHRRLRHAKAAQRAFYARGERTWQQYRRDGIASPAVDVFDSLADAYALIALADAYATRARAARKRRARRLGELGGQVPDIELVPRRRELDELVSRVTPENRHPLLLE